ncbi:MAG: calcium-binding protein [Alphaproteobacteria bacterium]|nr:calcium-binding protein [Alphaproteobacteria bacterium]
MNLLKNFFNLTIIVASLTFASFSANADTDEAFNYTPIPTYYDFQKIDAYQTCNKGYIMYKGECYLQLKCKNGGYQNYDRCVCPEGWTGNMCQTAKKCPYTTKTCKNGYYPTGNTCKSGKNTYQECKENTCKGYDYAKCPTGYAALKTEMCQSGKTKKYKCSTCAKGYIMYQGRCIKELKCKNGGYQDYDRCVCPEGWTGNMCQTAKKCPYTTKTCKNGYYPTGNTCKSGKNTYQECKENLCKGYNYTKCPTGYAALKTEMCQSGKTKKYKCTTCAKGYIMYQGKCIKELKCKNGQVQQYNQCVCPKGWTGNKCQTPVTCPYSTKSCANGYEETGNTCQSGNTIYKECRKNSCSGYNTLGTSCAKGYKQEGSVCYSGNNSYVKCIANTCPTTHNTKGSCSKGYTQVGEPCYSGADTYVQCQKTTCPYSTTSCSKGYEETGNTCQSGNTIYKECRIKSCSGYTIGSCPTNAKDCSTCYRGETETYKFTQCKDGWTGADCNTIINCDDFEFYACPINSICKQCISGNSTKYKITGCKEGWTGSDCEIAQTCPYNTITCPEGTSETGNTCKSGNTTYVECAKDCSLYPLTTYPSNCQEIQTCISNNTTKYKCNKCRAGYGRNKKGECVQLSDNIVLKNSTINNENKTKVNDNYAHVYGMKNTEDTYNSYSSKDAKLNITNNSDGRTYGIYSEASSYNAYTPTDIANGYISITNTGNGDTFGLYGKTGATNAKTDTGFAQGNISIDSIGNGNVYGMFTMFAEFNENQIISDVLTKNAEAEAGDTIASISIKNQGEGVVYGINAGSTGINALSNTGLANATIDIENIGNRNVYGMYAEYLIQNSTSNRSNADAEINIKNTGNGNVYGLYSNGYAHNVAGYSEATTSGSINITNKGNGDIIAITSADQYNTDAFNKDKFYFTDISSYHLYNARANNADATANIYIKNEGDGNIKVFNTILNNDTTFSQYGGNITYNTYAFNNGTAKSNIKIENTNSSEKEKSITLSGETLNLAYAEKGGKAINNI